MAFEEGIFFMQLVRQPLVGQGLHII